MISIPTWDNRHYSAKKLKSSLKPSMPRKVAIFRFKKKKKDKLGRSDPLLTCIFSAPLPKAKQVIYSASGVHHSDKKAPTALPKSDVFSVIFFYISLGKYSHQHHCHQIHLSQLSTTSLSKPYLDLGWVIFNDFF